MSTIPICMDCASVIKHTKLMTIKPFNVNMKCPIHNLVSVEKCFQFGLFCFWNNIRECWFECINVNMSVYFCTFWTKTFPVDCKIDSCCDELRVNQFSRSNMSQLFAYLHCVDRYCVVDIYIYICSMWCDGWWCF